MGMSESAFWIHLERFITLHTSLLYTQALLTN